MSDYNHRYPLETKEVDAAVESAGEYRQMLTALQADDLPRFEARFKELLNENTIREVANFQSQLHRERETIKERISQINDSPDPDRLQSGPLYPIGSTAHAGCRHPRLPDRVAGLYRRHTDRLRQRAVFRSQVFAGQTDYRALQRPRGQTDLDKRWTLKVTDVRNWFTFAASERWREDDNEHEHYSDSGGKSGGQRKTGLHHSGGQFGLSVWPGVGAVRSRTFRFVVIDEAFGRGSDESAEYGLKLFAQLNLQLLIVTPLQKIHHHRTPCFPCGICA